MTKTTKAAESLILAAALAVAPAWADDSSLPKIFEETFEDGNADGWKPTDESAWEVKEDKDGSKIYALIKKRSDYQPPHRSPHNIALRDDAVVEDFVLRVKMKTTEESYGHRSLCLFFGYQDPSHFYYVHFGQEADDHANQIFIVNDAPRTKISTKTTDGTPWKEDTWHDVKIVRNAASGAIEVYFDDMETPVMTASDKTFPSGKIGLGSFDDTGVFDNVVLFAAKKE